MMLWRGWSVTVGRRSRYVWGCVHVSRIGQAWFSVCAGQVPAGKIRGCVCRRGVFWKVSLVITAAGMVYRVWCFGMKVVVCFMFWVVRIEAE